MAYVPQFIPTNTQVLQGTLDQYQKGYDTETARQNQVNDVYSAIPTVGVDDTIDKTKLMEGFSNKLTELDKKYNYDRSNQQYAKDLAKEITGLRSNPLWSHVQRKDELNKIREQLIAQRGQDYIEPFNPNDVSVKESAKLQSWIPGDLKDVREAAGVWGKETANNIGRSEVTYPVKGLVQFADYTGYDNTTDASNYLNSPEGSAMLKQTITSRGFDPSNPKVYQEAYSSALSNLVGNVKIERRADTDENILARMAAKNKTSGNDNSESKLVETNKVSDIVYQSPANTEKATMEIGNNLNATDQALKDTNAKLAEAVKNNDQVKVKELTNKKDQQESQKFKLQSDYDWSNSVVQKYRTDEVGSKIMDSGANLIKSYFPSLKKEDANKIINKVVDAHIESSDLGMSPAGSVVGDIGSFFLDRLTHLGGIKGIIGSIVNPGASSLPAVVKEANQSIKERKSSDIIYNLAGGVYKQSIESGVGKLQSEKKAMNFIEELKNFHSGFGNYVGAGYDVIDKRIRADLDAGVAPVMHEFYLTGVKPEEKTEAKNLIIDNIDDFSFVDIKAGKETGQIVNKDANKLKEIFKNSDSELKFHIDNEGLVLFQLNDPKTNTTSVVKIDPAKSSFDVLDRLQQITKDNRLTSQMFSNFDIKEKKEGYSLSGDSNYVMNQLGNYFRDGDNKPDLSAFEGYKLKKSKTPDGGYSYDLYTNDRKEPYSFPNKLTLLDALANIRKSTNENVKGTAMELSDRPTGGRIDLSNIKGIDDYIYNIGVHESRGNYSAINNRDGKKEPALGLYQFLPSTIKGLGFNVTNDQFLKDPALQNNVMRKFIQDNIDTIARLGYKIDPNNLTDEAKALLTVAHYGGPSAANALIHNNPWLRKSNPEKKWDSVNGTESTIVYPSVIEYLQKSMGIDSTKLNFNQSKK